MTYDKSYEFVCTHYTDKCLLSTVRTESNELSDFTAVRTFPKFLRELTVCSCNPSGLLRTVIEDQ